MGASWLKSVLLASSLEELGAAIGLTVEQLGFRYFIYRGRFPQSHPEGGEVRFDNCPDAWRLRCEHAWDSASNPVHLRALQEITPILWRHVPQGELFTELRALGLVTGVTDPVHGPSGQRSELSFVKNRGGQQAEREIQIALTKCHLLTTYVHDSAARILKRRSSKPVDRLAVPPNESLNERECAILAWIAAGKTISEIAGLLPISERTVNFHLYNARRKLGAANSRHAITKAIALGLIGPESESSPGRTRRMAG
jgi:DNA-binding CsgD family transcriptional regulator